MAKSNDNDQNNGALDYKNPDVYKKYLDMLHSEEYQKLQNIYSRKTTMDILGVARQENPHSSFISWLLNPDETHGLNDYPMKKFFETICFAYLKYGDKYLNADFCKNEISKEKYSLTDKDDDWKKAKDELIKKYIFTNKHNNPIKNLMSGNFKITESRIYREKKTHSNVSRRADIWIDLKIDFGDHKDKRLLLLIENKVTSSENDNQTINYINDITRSFIQDKDSPKAVDFFIPIYLYVATNEEMKDAVNPETPEKFPCESRLYLVLNYQYLMDGVFVPCLAKTSDEDIAGKIDEYINCLGKSIDTTQGDSANDKSKKNIVMAVSPREKKTALKLWHDHKDILTDIGKNMAGNDHFAISGDEDRQFYRTILRPVIDELSTSGDTEKEQLADEIRSQLNDKKLYYLKSADGNAIQFKSQGGKNRNISALAYYLLRQYLEDNKSKENPETLKEIRDKLSSKIGNKWLSGFFVTDEEVKEMFIQWKPFCNKDNGPVCGRYNGMSNPLDECPLAERSSNILGKNYLSPKNEEKRLSDDKIKEYLMKKTCPFFPDNENYALRKKCFGSINKAYNDLLPNESKVEEAVNNCKVKKRGEGCSCIYDFIHCFFIGGFESNYSDIFDKEGDFLKKIGYNDELPAAEYADGKKVYIAKWWFAEDVEKMIEALWGKLESCKYIAVNSEKVKGCLDFEIKS